MKLRTLRYHIAEGVRSIFKNGLMSLASIAIVSACIFIVITSLCIAVNIDFVLEQIEANVGISVMFGEEPDEKAIAQVEEQVKKIPHVTEVKYFSKDDALDQAKTMFGAEALESLREDNPLPRSFDIKVDSISNQNSVVSELKKIQENFENSLSDEAKKQAEKAAEEKKAEETTSEPVTNEVGAVVPAVISEGVVELTTQGEENIPVGSEGYVYKGIEKIRHAADITNALVTINIISRIVSLVLIGILCVISVGIIMNTIKLTVFIRKNEINIMKYVGATDWFIRWPFIIEGVVIGLVGAVIPAVVCWLGYDGIAAYVNGMPIIEKIASLKSASDIFYTITPVALGIGVLLGAIGSINSLERHLNV